MNKLTAAEKMLQNLGITEPKEIDIEAIAWTQNVKIKRRILDSDNENTYSQEQSYVSADTWFDFQADDELEVIEQTIRISKNEILSIIEFIDDRMLEERE